MSWATPQGNKQIRRGDHQAIMDMLIVKVVGNHFKTVDRVAGEVAIGPDNCERF